MDFGGLWVDFGGLWWSLVVYRGIVGGLKGLWVHTEDL